MIDPVPPTNLDHLTGIEILLPAVDSYPQCFRLSLSTKTGVNTRLYTGILSTST
jgi:hypothetical protein